MSDYISYPYPRESWPDILPKEVLIFAGDFTDRQTKKWMLLPDTHKPPLVLDIRKGFWTAIKAGEDTRILENFCPDHDLRLKFLALLENDPSILVEAMALARTSDDVLQNQLFTLFREMEKILGEPNMQDGDIHDKLIAQKVRIFTGFKGMMDSMIKYSAIKGGGSVPSLDLNKTESPALFLSKPEKIPDKIEEEKKPPPFKLEGEATVINKA